MVNEELHRIHERIQKAKDSGEWVLIENDDYGIIESHKVKIIYVGNRWATGEEVMYNGDDKYTIRHTINYTSLLGTGGHKTRLMFGGDNYFA